MRFKVLALGDVVGKPGRKLIHDRLRGFLRQQQVRFCVVNAENVADGSGVTPDCMRDLLESGANVLTSGDHIFKRREIAPVMDRDNRLLRPLNYAPEAAGKGYGLYETPEGVKVGVINCSGRVFMMPPADSPWHAVNAAVDKLRRDTNVILVDMHAEATSEKIAMGWYLDGRISFLFGTHTHVQTADERVLPKGTAYITDLGMCGPHDGVIGRRTDRVLQSFVTQMPCPFDVASDDVRLCGALVTIETATGNAVQIQRVVITQDRNLLDGAPAEPVVRDAVAAP
ncbi:MAG: TIGR00282 family metallophosphoesterase [Planctomycetes bacterium]|nr:TIGR00282 family metallophosphoesterase [Planctomycetota bacterium]